MQESKRGPKIKSVRRSYDIVETILDENGATTMEIAKRLDIPVSTTFDHLDTLEQLEYVVKEGDEYRISSKYLKMGNQMRSQREIHQYSRNHLDNLSRDIDEHAILMVEEDGYGIYFYIAESASSFRPVIDEGSRAMLHTNAPGKVLLAYMDEEQVEEVIETRGLPAMTDNTVTDSDELRDELVEIRDQRFGIDTEEVIEGMYGVATPILNRSDGTILGAIGVYSPADQEIEDFLGETLSPLQKTANTIELNITYEN